LEDARTEQDASSRTTLLEEASDIIVSEQPAVFLFEPATTYVVNHDFIIPTLANIGRPADRFNSISAWYTTSDELWGIFNRNN
jgi:hypothetical protein